MPIARQRVGCGHLGHVVDRLTVKAITRLDGTVNSPLIWTLRVCNYRTQ
jgi:hypothetical protein